MLYAKHHRILMPALVILAGCGGSGSSTSSEDAGVPVIHGFVEVRSSTAAKTPVFMSGSNASFTAVFGTTMSSASYRLPPLETVPTEEALKQSVIAYSVFNRPKILDYGEMTSETIGPRMIYSDSCRPVVSPAGTRVAAVQQDPSGKGVYTMNLDGSDRRLIHASTTVSHVAYSPDGKTLAIQDAGRIYVIPAGGGTPVPITPSGVSSWNPTYLDSGRIAFCRYDSVNTKFRLMKVKTDGTGESYLTGSVMSDDVIRISPIPRSNQFVYSVLAAGTYSIWHGREDGWTYQLLGVTGLVLSPSVAPTGDRFVYTRASASGQSLWVYNMETGSNTLIVPEGPNSYQPEDPFWGPYLANRTLIGNGGVFGLQCGGVLFGQNSYRVTSFVAFDATTRSTINVTPQSNPVPDQPVVLCNVTGDSLKSLKYLNDLRGGVVTVVSAASPVSGAVIGLSASTGKVVSVAPYVGAAAQRADGAYTADFVGVWDEKGENLAPSGAKTVLPNLNTGRVAFQ